MKYLVYKDYGTTYVQHVDTADGYSMGAEARAYQLRALGFHTAYIAETFPQEEL